MTGELNLRTLTLRLIAIVPFLALLVPVCSFAQAAPSAYVHGHSLYIGGEFALYDSDYYGGNQNLNKPAFSIYGDYGLIRGVWPVALDVNYTRWSGIGLPNTSMSSFLAGPKVSHHWGRWEPFAKLEAGFGHFSYFSNLDPAQQGDHLAIGFGGGVDYHLTNHIELRPIDFTSERWNFSPNALTPQILGFGLAYRIR